MSATGLKSVLKLSAGAIGLLAFLAILIAANIMLGNFHFRKDLTEEKTFTLSEGTRNVLKKLDAPVTLKYFITRSSAAMLIPLKTFTQQVEDLLKEYRLAADGKIIVEIYDPKPDSDAEEWAERYGLEGHNLEMMGPAIYCGLVAMKGDVSEIIPFIDPRSEELLEYNITRMISRVANPKKPVIGIMSSLPVMGVRAFPYAMPGQPQPKNQPPWAAFQDLSKDYDVRQVPLDAEQIAPDINVMVVIHPKNLSDKTLFALDQFVLQGGRLMAFVDPLCMCEMINTDSPSPDRSRPFSDLNKLTDAWGVKYEADQVVADLEAATSVQRSDGSIDNSPIFLSLRQENIDGGNVITAPLESLVLPGAGAFSGTGNETLNIESLLVSSPQSQLVNLMIAQLGSEAIRRDFQAGLKKMNLALCLRGRFKTAFPKGLPKGVPETDKANDKEQKSEESKHGEISFLKESEKPAVVILVADVDLLYDAFAVQELNLFGTRARQPMNDNINFFINAVDNLAGSDDLAKIRSRGRFDRPFDRVIALQRSAQEKWLLKERALQSQLESTRARLETLQSQKDKNQKYILSPEQEEEINRFRQEQVKTRRELKQVRKNLREGIEQLGVTVKAVNILLVPLLVAAAGLIFAWRRRSKTKSS
ncbi:MAG: GldG family protein [Kiritimatiellia bacterium]|nr:GldG family protein [Kiritimatiellia bacterium]